VETCVGEAAPQPVDLYLVLYLVEGDLVLLLRTSKIGAIFSDKSTELRSIYSGEEAYIARVLGVIVADSSWALLEGFGMALLGGGGQSGSSCAGKGLLG
jgi:hypothetical protein